MMIPKEHLMPDFCNRRQPFHYLTALNLLSGLGVKVDRIKLLAIGTFYNYKGEVHNQDPPPGSVLTEETEITLEVGCPSAVDFMPYQFFYGLSGRRDSDYSWEEAARALLAPFDAAVIRYHARMRHQSLQYDFNVIETDHLKRLLDLFGLELPDDRMSAGDVLYWLSILPAFHFWGGSAEAVAMVLSRTFGYTFKINENIRTTGVIPVSLRYKLGSKTGRLGRETILGKEFSEYDSAFEVVIENVPAKSVAEMFPGGRTRQEIERLLQFCMPADLDVVIKIKVDRPEKTTKEEINNYLGYSTYIN